MSDQSTAEFNANLGKFYQPSHLTVFNAMFFYGWVLVMPLNGPVLRILFEEASLIKPLLISLLLLIHIGGLGTGALLVKSIQGAWYAMFTSVIISMVGSGIFLTDFTDLWTATAVVMAFLAGLYLSSLGYFLKFYVPSEKRFVAVADILIGANLLMIVINVLTINWDVRSGELLALVLLLCALLSLLRLQRIVISEVVQKKAEDTFHPVQKTLIRPFVWLCVFIALITLNAGITQQVVMPVFQPFMLLTSVYWAVPYIVALLILRNLPKQVNRAQMLYVALAMMGLGYLLFARLQVSASSFLLINSLMLFAIGVFDLFWWSLMGSFLDYANRPALILGLGLAANTLGTIIGRITGEDMVRMPGSSASDITFNVFVVIFISLAIIPLLNSELSRLFSQHIFLMNLAPYRKQKDAVDQMEMEILVNPLIALQESYQLTDREMEVVELLNQGYTYKAISEVLIISENTTKYHAKNIYQKMHVNNKMELIKLISPLMQVNQDV